MKKIILLLILASIYSATAEESSIGYASVSEALDALQNDPSIQIFVQEGWTIAQPKDSSKFVLWSFTPDTHYAHPAVVRREVVERDGKIFIQMRALCEASKSNCDNLVKEFEALNEKIRQSMQKNS